MKSPLSDNEIIAQFMGYEKDAVGLYLIQDMPHIHASCLLSADHLDFHRSWDWLMPVVEKISKIDFPKDDEQKYFEFQDEAECVENIRIGHTSIEHVYKAVVEFIKWYNDSKKV